MYSNQNQYYFVELLKIYEIYLIFKLAKKYNMVIVSPILERESIDHGEIIWNTAGI